MANPLGPPLNVDTREARVDALIQAASESETREFITGARRDADNGKPRLDYLPWRALRSLGAYMRESAARFGACNYRRGMPLSELNASMLRHAADYQTAHSQDEAVRALHGVLFNASVALEQIILGRDDLDDMDVIRDGARPDAEFIAPRAPDIHSVRVDELAGLLNEYADRSTGYIYADEIAVLREAAEALTTKENT